VEGQSRTIRSSYWGIIGETYLDTLRNLVSTPITYKFYEAK